MTLTLTSCNEEEPPKLICEIEGIKVYRFYDGGRYHYITSNGNFENTRTEKQYVPIPVTTTIPARR